MTDDAKHGRHRTLERDAFKALQKDAGIPHPPTRETYDFRLAVSGQGCLAYQWADKPHRLLYDACSIIEREAALRQPQTDALKIAREAWQPIETAPPERVPLLLWAKRKGDPTFRQVCGWRYGGMWAIYGCGRTQDCIDSIEPTHWRYQDAPPKPALEQSK